MIGDGVQMPKVKEIIRSRRMHDKCTLTGYIPQEEGPYYLAACDILVSPTLKNSDGTCFFGSPTKLYEYMAMGRAIIASNLEQMSEVLRNGTTALLVEPNNSDALAHAITKLIDDDKLRTILGKNACDEARDKYTWEIHTTRIYQALKQRFS